MQTWLALLYLAALPFAGESPLPSVMERPRPPAESIVSSLYDLSRFHAEDWAATEDWAGRIYLANYDGVLVGSGQVWRLIQTSNLTTVRSLSFWEDGHVYVGAQGELGYLDADSRGELRFVSLAEKLPEDEREFGDVWATHAASNGVYFQTSFRVYFWDGTRFTIYRSENGFHTSFLVDDELIVRERERGLVRLRDGESELLTGGEFYADKRVHLLVKETGGLLVGTRDNGFFRWSGTSSVKVKTEADSILNEAWLYGGTELYNGEIALATLGAGVVIMDRQGRLTGWLHRTNGAPDDHITSLFPLRSGLVVATTHNAGVFTFYPPSVLSEVANLEAGGINDVYIDREYAMLSTGGGSVAISLDSVRAYIKGASRPIGVRSGLTTSWASIASGHLLYVATESGLFATARDHVLRASPSEYDAVRQQTQVFSLGNTESGAVIAGHRNGIGVVRGAEWVGHQQGSDIDEVVSIASDDFGIWATTRIDGVRRYRAGDPLGSPPVKYSSDDGLPANERLVVTMVGGAPLFYAKESAGLYRFESSTGMFQPDPHFGGAGIESAAVYDIHESADGVVWFALDDGIARAVPLQSGRYQVDRPDLLSFVRNRNTYLRTEPDGALWITLDNRILRYDAQMDGPFDSTYDVLIEQVISTSTDSLLFGGFRFGRGTSSPVAASLRLPFDHRGIRVEFGAPVLFDMGQPVEFRTFLHGQDSEWQPWAQATSRTISDEMEGHYVLRIQARNMFGTLSREARVDLTILPPWYRTWWAYLIYVAGTVLLLAFTVKYRRMLRAQKRAQEQAEELARERRYSHRLQEANDELKRVNRLKDEFLATTSHELRTPITAILGFTEVLQSEIPPDAPYREFVSIIEESGQRLMGTLTSLLDVARIRAGTMEFAPEHIDFSGTVRESAEPWRARAEEKGLYFKVLLPSDRMEVYHDPVAIDRITQHLLDNAVKFTERGGITVEVAREPNGVSIRVHDTGIGIEPVFLPNLFEEFVQESDGESRSYNGTGLGLSIVGGLVRLMGGRVDVHSLKGVGSVFKVLLPSQSSTPEPDREQPASSRRLPAAGAEDRAPSGPGHLRKVVVPRESPAD